MQWSKKVSNLYSAKYKNMPNGALASTIKHDLQLNKVINLKCFEPFVLKNQLTQSNETEPEAHFRPCGQRMRLHTTILVESTLQLKLLLVTAAGIEHC